MAQSFFFYDLETSGLSPRDARIMQFAGIRTDLDLQQIGEPYNVIVTLNDDTLPSPEALMVTKITPQQTAEEGYTEAQFAKILQEEVFTEDTIVVGFNNIRFDDEFLRALFWRTFYDPYEWSWKNGRSRWDMLDVVRITRALRPEGITWPVVDGKPSNRLELLTKENGIEHLKAHDALSDVEALIAVTQLIKDKQPHLYDYLLKMRDKREVQKVVSLDNKQPFVYTSGRYDAEFQKTTVAFPLIQGRNNTVIVYDLRYDPTPLISLSVEELKERLFASWEDRNADGFMKVPVKQLQFNRAPAVAPLGVLEQSDGWNKVQLTKESVERHRKILLGAVRFAENVREALESRPEFPKQADAEAQLYDGFVGDKDKLRIETVRNATGRELKDFQPRFDDQRLTPLLLRYKARNFPQSLSSSESQQWEEWRTARIARQLPDFLKSLQTLSGTVTSEQDQFILQELQLWVESIAPSDVGNQDSLG